MVVKLMSRFFLCAFLMSTVAGLIAQDSIESVNQIQDISSNKIENFVRGIQKELDMESYRIEVVLIETESALAAFCPHGYYVLYINESWFKKLSCDAQRFVIGHELMHIQLGHILNNIARGNTLSVFRQDNPLMVPIWAYFSRQDEKEADLSSALELKCAQGGIDFLEEALKEENVFWAKKKIPLVIAKSVYYCLLSDHPSIEIRIKYLKDLMKSSDYQKAKVV